MVVRNGEREGLAISCTQKTLPGACHSTLFLVSTHCALRGSRSSCVRVIHSHPARAFSSCVFDVVAQCQVYSVPSLLSSPCASSSRAPMSLTGRTRSWCQSPDAPARWRESVRLVDSAPNTGYEPNLANSSSCTHPEHTAIDIPDRHQDFWCSDVVTMMSTSAESIPNSEALSSSCKAAVSKVSSAFGHYCHPCLRRTHLEQNVPQEHRERGASHG